MPPPGRDEILDTYDPPSRREILQTAEIFMARRPSTMVHDSRLVLRDHFLRTFPTAHSMQAFLAKGQFPADLKSIAGLLPRQDNPIDMIAQELRTQQQYVLPDTPAHLGRDDPLAALSNFAVSGTLVYPTVAQEVLHDFDVPVTFSTFMEAPFSYPGGRRMEGLLFLTLPPGQPRWTQDTIYVAGERLATATAYTSGLTRTRVFVHDLPENMLAPEKGANQRERLAQVGVIQMVGGQPVFDPTNPTFLSHRPAVLDQQLHEQMAENMAMTDLGYSRTLVKNFNEASADGNFEQAALVNSAHLHHTLRTMRRTPYRAYNQGSLPELRH